MGVIATAVRHLMAAGVTGDALVAAIADLEAEQPKDRAAENRRAYDRERRRKEREEAKSGGCPVESTGYADNPTPALSPQTPLSHPHPEINKPARVRGQRLPTDWQPQALNGEVGAAVALWPPGAIERELARFKDWAASATGQNAVKTDWQAAWRNWLRKAEDEGRYGRKRADENGAGAGSMLEQILARTGRQDKIQ